MLLTPLVENRVFRNTKLTYQGRTRRGSAWCLKTAGKCQGIPYFGVRNSSISQFSTANTGSSSCLIVGIYFWRETAGGAFQRLHTSSRVINCCGTRRARSLDSLGAFRPVVPPFVHLKGNCTSFGLLDYRAL